VSNPERDRSARSEVPATHVPLSSGPAPKPGITAERESSTTTRAQSRSLLELDEPGRASLPERRTDDAHSETREIAAAFSSMPTAVPGARPSLAPSAPVNENAVSETRPISHTARADSDPASPALETLGVRLDSLTAPGPLPDSDAVALQDASDSVLSPGPAPEPDVKTRAHTHVAPEAWFDTSLPIAGVGAQTVDPRQRLAWRFKAAFSGWKMLLPLSPSLEIRTQVVTAMRSYERLLRAAGPTPRDDTKQISDALHGQLNDAQVSGCDRALSELEGLLLAIDESISNDAFRIQFSRQREHPRQLLRYARLLAARRFGIGYRRDRFEGLALDLLTAKLPSGKLVLMPRKRAGQVLQQLLRGLYRPPVNADEQAAALTYLRDALDRVESLAGPKQFFDSGFFLDVYGYKIAMHDRITSPEFLYLSVALDVEIHNRMQTWGQGDIKAPGAGSLASLQIQLRAQQEAAQAVFTDFHRPLAGTASRPAAAKKSARRPERTPAPAAADNGRLRLMAAGFFALVALAANLWVTGVVKIDQAPQAVSDVELKSLSPLLVNGRVTRDGKRFMGLVSRPAWYRMSPRQRNDEAVRFAAALKRRGIEHAEVLAYETRALQIEYGTVVYVDDAR
jgi:hypothetical protein